MNTTQPDATRPLLLVSVVDPDPLVRASLASVLGQQHFKVTLFPDAETLLMTWNSAPEPDCLVMEWQLPGLSGSDLLAELERRQCKAAVIVLAGQGEVRTAVSALRAGALDCVEKPFSPQVLAAGIRHLLGSPPPQDA